MMYCCKTKWLLSIAIAGCILVVPGLNAGCQHSTTTSNNTASTSPPATTSIVRITAQQLFDEYHSDKAQADLRYKEKTIQVTGVITEVSDASHQEFSMGVNGGSIEFFASSITAFVKAVKGKTVTAQGICQGISLNGNPSLAYVSIVS